MKSGTTSIQRYLSDNSKAYKAEGILYPNSGRTIGKRRFRRHVGFRFATRDPKLPPNLMMPRLGLKEPKAIRRYANQFVDEFDREIEFTRPNTLIISDESLFQGVGKESLSRVSSFLRARFDEILVCCSLRNPYDYVRGVVSSAIKEGNSTDIKEHCRAIIRGGIFLPALHSWSEFFSDDEMRVYVAEGESIAKLLSVASLPKLAPIPRRRRNRSLTSLGARYLQNINKRYTNGKRPEFFHVFKNLMVGEPFELPPDATKAIWTQFETEVSGIKGFLTDLHDIEIVENHWIPHLRDNEGVPSTV